jgi:hypothetical protein
MYASNIPNLDPKPWERPTTGERFEEFYDADLIFNPRDDFKVYPVNEVNRILLDFRRLINEIIDGWEPTSIRREAGYWIFLLDGDPYMRDRNRWGDMAGTCSEEDIAFAQRVLYRLSGGQPS